MKMLQPTFRLSGLLLAAGLAAACTNPGYNDNPSQQMTNGRVGCLAATEFFAVYFNVHIQPSADTPETRLTREVFRSYCEDIPRAGTVFFTADLVGNELKGVPLGIRVVEQEPAGLMDGPGGSDKDFRVLSEIPPKAYKKGFIEVQFDADRNGYYAIDLIRGGDDAVSEHDMLRIPLNVGVESGLSLLLTKAVTLAAIAAGIVLAGSAALRIWRKAGNG